MRERCVVPEGSGVTFEACKVGIVSFFGVPIQWR